MFASERRRRQERQARACSSSLTCEAEQQRRNPPPPTPSPSPPLWLIITLAGVETHAVSSRPGGREAGRGCSAAVVTSSRSNRHTPVPVKSLPSSLCSLPLSPLLPACHPASQPQVSQKLLRSLTQRRDVSHPVSLLTTTFYLFIYF